MGEIFLVGIGGFVGSVLRYVLSGWIHRILDNPWFPYGTLGANVLGCFLIGFLAGLAEIRGLFTSETRLLVFIGVLGGFTTFSSFAFETFSLAKNVQTLAALMNIALQLVLGLIAVWVGQILARLW
jgi:CrcB protein